MHPKARKEQQGPCRIAVRCHDEILQVFPEIWACMGAIFQIGGYLTLRVPEELQLYGLYVYYVVHICDFGMLRVKYLKSVCCRSSLK